MSQWVRVGYRVNILPHIDAAVKGSLSETCTGGISGSPFTGQFEPYTAVFPLIDCQSGQDQQAAYG